MADPAGWEGILGEGETILWQGRPDSAVIWSDVISAQSAFGVVFAGFATFWVVMAAAIGGAGPAVFDLFPLFGLPFVAVGLWMVVGRLLWDAFLRRGTWYTLTDRAAYIATSPLGRRALKSYPLAQMKLSLDDGSPGSVWFAERVVTRSGSWSGSGDDRTWQPARSWTVPVGFVRIADARRVYAQLRGLVDRTTGRGAAG